MYQIPGMYRTWKATIKPTAWLASLIILEIFAIYGAVLLVGIAIRGLL